MVLALLGCRGFSENISTAEKLILTLKLRYGEV